ncbi:MAG: DUF3387 domain-containing protein [Pseudonocardiaceae bacterium]|nr:DUF3387 domain-containing protein [Pseudonocardiaceae bacterium]
MPPGAAGWGKRPFLRAAHHTVNYLRDPATPGNQVPDGQETLAARYRTLSGQLARAWAISGGDEQLAARRRDAQFYEEVRVWMAKYDAAQRQATGQPLPDDIRRLLNQLVAESTASGDVVDIYDAAGMPRPTLDDLTPSFLAATQQARNPHLAIEALRAMLAEESTRATGGNVVRQRAFSDRITELMRPAIPEPTVLAVVSRYLSESARSWLAENGISYLDATGNLRLVSSEPAVYLQDKGAESDPWRGPGRPRGTRLGLPAARVVRALADFRAPLSVRSLVERSGASTGGTYRVLEFLEEEALLCCGERGVVESVRWRPLLERWSKDYGFQRSNAVSGYLHPRGLPALLADLRSTPEMAYVVTGSLAAQQWASCASPRLAMLYADNVPACVRPTAVRTFCWRHLRTTLCSTAPRRSTE